MIRWPCIVKMDGSDELIFVADSESLHLECEGLIVTANDYLIDSDGQQSNLEQVVSGNDSNEVVKVLSIEDVTELVRRHEFSKHEACLTKIGFSSIEQAIQSVDFEQ